MHVTRRRRSGIHFCSLHCQDHDSRSLDHARLRRPCRRYSPPFSCGGESIDSPISWCQRSKLITIDQADDQASVEEAALMLHWKIEMKMADERRSDGESYL